MSKIAPETLRANLGNVQRKPVATASMTVLNAVQDFQPQVQIAAIALVFERTCKQAGIAPSEALQIANNVFTDGERVHPEFRAVDLFCNYQLFRKE